MARTFIDTNVYVAYLNPRDALHERAVAVLARIVDDDIIMSEYVFDELLNVLTRRVNKRVAVLAGTEVRRTSVAIAFTNAKELEEAWRIFTGKNRFSFTDAVLLAQMRAHGADRIATFDAEFGKAGVTVID